MAYDNDQASLLALRMIVQGKDPCIYLEIGSEYGWSLRPALLDPECIAVHSVDLRPVSTPDGRGRTWEYNSTTAAMVHELSQTATKEQMAKLSTYDMDTGRFKAVAQIPANLVFLDAEHTNTAVFQDFLNLYDMLPSDTIFAGHDSNLIFDALVNIEAMLAYRMVPFHLAYLSDVVFAFAFGKYIAPVKALPHWDPKEYVRYARQTLNDDIVNNAALRTRIENTGVLIP
jgi:hypothetical protein